jgi:hypothetical protein
MWRNMLNSGHAKLYRKKAEELRQLASRLSAFSAKKDMEAVAILYERLADQIDPVERKRTPNLSS